MTARADHGRLARLGLLPMTGEQAVTLFDAATVLDQPLVMAARIDPSALRGRGDGGTLAPVWRSLVRGAGRRGAGDADPADGGPPLTRALAGLPVAEQRRTVLNLVRTHAATVLGRSSATTIDAERGFVDLGFDSLTAVELRNRLGASTGLRLPSTLVFDYPNPDALARYVHAELTAHLDAVASTADDVAPAEEIDEAELRRLIASIPVRRLHEAGLVAVLKELAGHGQQPATETAATDLIDTMDVDDLLKLAPGKNI
jgi:acyl carrier protein